MIALLSKWKLNLEKETQKYEKKAKEYIHSPHKTEKLLKSAYEKARHRKGSLMVIWDRLILFFDLARAYMKGEYRQISKGTILTIISAIIYFVSPFDLIPDFIAGFGILDDAAVIQFAIKKISPELDAFQKWKDQKSE